MAEQQLTEGLTARASADAQLRIGRRYAASSPSEPIRALVWVAAAASGGSDEARAQLSSLAAGCSADVWALVARAVQGELEAQRELAVRLNDAAGFPKDSEAALCWIRRAAESGDAWCQTTYALSLGAQAGDALAGERYEWLARAAAQRDARAMLNVGLSQVLGHGTAADLVSGVVHIINSSLMGFSDSRAAVERVLPLVSEEHWSEIVRSVYWPRLVVSIGPLIAGHLPGLNESRVRDPLSEDADWWKYDLDAVKLIFSRSASGSSPFLDQMFEAQVDVARLDVARMMREGQPFAQVRISFADLFLSNGIPVYWIPERSVLNTVERVVGLMAARDWMHWEIEWGDASDG